MVRVCTGVFVLRPSAARIYFRQNKNKAATFLLLPLPPVMLHEKPEELIKSSIESFEIEPDLLTLNRIEETISKTNLERANKIEVLQNNIKKASGEYKTLRDEFEALQKSSTLVETLNSLGNGEEEGEKINGHDNIFKSMNKKSIELDNLKVSLAKKLNELERQINSLNIEKVNLTKQQQDLVDENENSINSNLLSNFDSKIMKINLYKNLGVLLESGEDEQSENDKLIIYNKFADLTSVLKVDEKYSDYFITNYIWDKLPGAEI